MTTATMLRFGPSVDSWPIFEHSDPQLRYPERMNITEMLLDKNIDRGLGGKVAILHKDERLTYAEVLLKVNRLASGLVKMGVGQGDRVMLRLSNTPEFIVSSLAVQRIGGICVPTHPQLKAREIAHIANDSESKLIVVHASLADGVKEAIPLCNTIAHVLAAGRYGESMTPAFLPYEEVAGEEVEPHPRAVKVDQDEAALLLYTSGTSGQPKSCIHTHRSYLAVADCYGKQVLGASEDDVFGGTPSLAFAYGHTGLLCIPLRFGAAVSLMDGPFDPETCFAAIDRHRITVFYGVPTSYRMMLKKVPDAEKRYSLSSLRVAVTAGEPCPPELYAEWTRRTRVEMLEHLGSTEMLDGFLSSRLGNVKAGSVGTPVPGYRINVVDDAGRSCPPLVPGSLAVIGPTGTRYWKAPDRQRQVVREGWNYTGDIVSYDHDGYFWYVGREDDIIKSAAYRISPFEVEQVLVEHPAVLEAAVVGVPDHDRGQRVKAFAVLKDGACASPELAEEILIYVRRRIAAYKAPRELEFRSQLPRTVNGKVVRAQLIAQQAQTDARVQSFPRGTHE